MSRASFTDGPCMVTRTCSPHGHVTIAHVVPSYDRWGNGARPAPAARLGSRGLAEPSRAVGGAIAEMHAFACACLVAFAERRVDVSAGRVRHAALHMAGARPRLAACRAQSHKGQLARDRRQQTSVGGRH